MLEVQNLSYSFGDKKVLNELSLTVQPKTIHSIVGLSGAGKTLLLKLLCGLQEAQTGRISGVPEKKSFVFQKQSFFPWLTILKNLELCTHLHQDELQRLMKQFRLNDYSEKYPYQLSGGTLQKVNVLRAFIAKADIIFMDEPFVHLDLAQKDELYEFTLRLWEDYKPTIIVVSHDLDEALFLSHHISYLSKKSGAIAQSMTLPPRTSSDFSLQKALPEQQKLYAELYSKLKEELV